LFSNNYNKIIDKNNLLIIKLTLRMQNKSVIIRNFNLHYFFWASSFYFKQHLFSKNLLNINARNRRNINSFSKNYNKKLSRHLNYNQLIVCYKENDKSINILRYKRENKKLIWLFFNKNNAKFSNTKEVSTSS